MCQRGEAAARGRVLLAGKTTHSTCACALGQCLPDAVLCFLQPPDGPRYRRLKLQGVCGSRRKGCSSSGARTSVCGLPADHPLPQRLAPQRVCGQAYGGSQQQAAHHLRVVAGEGQVVQRAEERSCNLCAVCQGWDVLLQPRLSWRGAHERNLRVQQHHQCLQAH